MKFRSALLPAMVLTALTIAACSPQETSSTAAVPAAKVAAKQAVSIDTVAAQGKGFAVGALMSTNTVYVFFDAQCPHCGHLWQSSVPLQRKVKFVWIPVGWINASSTAQGAALLTAANPAALMTEHEASLLDRRGGISAPSNIPDDVLATIKANTQLLNSFGAEAVPFIVAKNLKSGQTVSRDGAMDTAALAEFLGVDPQ